MLYTLKVNTKPEQTFDKLVDLRNYVNALIEYDSATGRRPLLLWTPEWQENMARMKADFEAGHNATSLLASKFYGLMRSNALRATPAYGDTGLWGTLMYQATGDPVYAEKAWGVLTAGGLARTVWDGNRVREYGAEYVLLYDWLYPWMDEAKRVQYLAMLDNMFEQALSYPSMPPAFPIRSIDSMISQSFTLTPFRSSR